MQYYWSEKKLDGLTNLLVKYLTLLIDEIISAKKRGHGSKLISYKINFRHPGQLKKWKSWEPFWSYQLNSTANPAHLPQNWPNWQCCLAGSSKTAPRILILSVAMGADYSFYVKSIADLCPHNFGM